MESRADTRKAIMRLVDAAVRYTIAAERADAVDTDPEDHQAFESADAKLLYEARLLVGLGYRPEQHNTTIAVARVIQAAILYSRAAGRYPLPSVATAHQHLATLTRTERRLRDAARAIYRHGWRPEARLSHEQSRRRASAKDGRP